MLAFFWGSYLLWYLFRLTTYKEEEMFDCLFISLGGALFFARLVYVLFNFNKFGFDPLKFILINGYPGLSLLGALFGGWLTGFLFLLHKKIKFLFVIDYFVASLFLALAISKLGSFFAGIEIGTKTKFFLAVRYFGFEGSRHLTPFYEGLMFFFAAYLSYRILFEIRKERLKNGFNGLFFIWFFSLVSYLFDGLKEKQRYLDQSNFNQNLYLIFFLTTSLYFIYYFKTAIINLVKEIFYAGKNLYKKTAGKIRKRKRKNPDSDRKS